MTTKIALQYASIAIIVGCFTTIAFMIRRKAVREYPFLVALLAVRGLMSSVAVALLFHRKDLGLSLDTAWDSYFYSYWVAAVSQLAFQVLIIYGVFRIAMKPLDGLKRVGTIIFRWVASVSILLSVMVALGPHVKGLSYFPTLMGQVQEGVSVLTLCLLLFVCFATRPLGLTFRSRVFGITLGLGVSSTMSLVQSAWTSTDGAQNVYSPMYLFAALASLVALVVWGGYFAMPEPKRVMVLLPTTSPYFLWNSISEALGSNPGEVAISGFSPEMLAPAEVTAMTAASRFAKEFSAAEAEPIRFPLAASM